MAYYRGGDTCQKGFAFVVHKDIAGNVTSFKGISDRVACAQLTIKVNAKYKLNIIQAYLQISSHYDEDVDAVYEDLNKLINNSKAYVNIIMGDFNAEVGSTIQKRPCIGPFGLGT